MLALSLFHAVALTLLVALGAQAVLNARAIRRLRPAARPSRWPSVSVLIPARNEASRIDACMRAWRAQDYPRYEVVVCDDESTDDTAARARRAAEGAANVRVIDAGRLPAGWRGKTHACHRLREHARGEMLLFVDADVVPQPSALTAAVAARETLGANALSALPSHAPVPALLRAVAGVQNWAAMTFVPSWVTALRHHPMMAVMNGQFITIPAAVYDAVGGFAAVYGSLSEDTALGRRLVAAGYRVDLVDGSTLLACRSYTKLADLWRGNVRNLRAVLLGSPWLLALSATCLTALYLGPLVVLVVGGVFGRTGSLAWTWLPLAEATLGIGARAFVDRRSGHGAWLAVVHPVAVAALVAMQVDAVARTIGRREVDWRGRRYRLRDETA
jgi:cellulose synthase/poly-beta-1,6-N-acetylglucosamine synthase-like glycosyltransferase